MLHTTLIVRHATQVYSSQYLSANNFEMLLESEIPSTVLLLPAEWDLMCLISDQKLRLLLFSNPVPYNLCFIFPYSPYGIMISSPAATHTVSHRASMGPSTLHPQPMPEDRLFLQSCVRSKGRRLISDSSSLRQAPAEAARPWTQGHCAARCACLPPRSLCLRQIMLLGDRCVRTRANCS